MAFKVVLMAILALAGASGCRPAKVPDQDNAARRILQWRRGARRCSRAFLKPE
jgi:ferritin-like protein